MKPVRVKISNRINKIIDWFHLTFEKLNHKQMKQRVITLIIILLTFFSILSANYQVLNELNVTDYLYSKTILAPKTIESKDGAVEQEQKCTRDQSLSEISNFLVPARLILPYINK